SARLGLGGDGGPQISGDHRALAPVGAAPAPVGLGGLDLLETVLGHPAFLDQPGDIVDVDLAPDTLLGARRVALQEALGIETLAQAVDPAPAQHDVDRLFRRDRLQARADLVDLDPDFIG